MSLTPMVVPVYIPGTTDQVACWTERDGKLHLAEISGARAMFGDELVDWALALSYRMMQDAYADLCANLTKPCPSAAAQIVANGEAAINALHDRLEAAGELLHPAEPEERPTAATSSSPIDSIILTELSEVENPLADVMKLIERLDREDRAKLRPWILAKYEDDGSEHRRVHDR